ncbi:MAG: 2-C-methyl-D-erythritol 4-phosphate cytidylyltransferase [Chitinophagaceae bacterium]|nr:2-C-methyl-D-erythritol 4-phosphate cytidylyltransferase [Chitinophagaceae bacterium]
MISTSNKYAVIVAGGSGKRMGNVTPKQFLEIHGKPLLVYSIDAFLLAYPDMKVILVLPANFIKVGTKLAEVSVDPARVLLTEGGETRFHSVQNGLHSVPASAIVFVHDAVRCLIGVDLIQRCFECAREHGTAVPAIAATDSIRIITGEHNEAVDRERVKIIQTPQTFSSDILKVAYRQEYHHQFTDDASVVEKAGMRIQLLEGEPTNIKVTRPIDLLLAEKILADRKNSITNGTT